MAHGHSPVGRMNRRAPAWRIAGLRNGGCSIDRATMRALAMGSALHPSGRRAARTSVARTSGARPSRRARTRAARRATRGAQGPCGRRAARVLVRCVRCAPSDACARHLEELQNLGVAPARCKVALHEEIAEAGWGRGGVDVDGRMSTRRRAAARAALADRSSDRAHIPRRLPALLRGRWPMGNRQRAPHRRKFALLTPPISSTYSCVSLKGALSKPILPPGELEMRKPKSMCTM